MINLSEIVKSDEPKIKEADAPPFSNKNIEKATEIFNALFSDDIESRNEMSEKNSNEVNESVEQRNECEKGFEEETTENNKSIMEHAMDIFNDLFSEDFENQTQESVAQEQYEYDEGGTRELREEEKQMLKDRLGWSDDKIDKNCRIDENGVIQYKTDCQYLEGQCSECGVPYERKMIEINGVKIEGVFPVFDSTFDVEIPEDIYQSSSSKQFNECNKKLKEAVENNELKQQFTEEQLQDIENGDTPRGYTWHHNETPGQMQLVKTEDHDRTIGGAAHTGGNSLWGNKSQGAKKEGVMF